MPRRSLQQKFNQYLRFFSRHALPPHRIFSRRVYRCGSDPVKLLWIDRTTAQPNDLGFRGSWAIRKRVNVKHHIWKKMTFIQGPITPVTWFLITNAFSSCKLLICSLQIDVLLEDPKTGPIFVPSLRLLALGIIVLRKEKKP